MLFHVPCPSLSECGHMYFVSVRKCVGVNVNERTEVHNVRRRGFNRTEAEIVVVQAVVNTR